MGPILLAHYERQLPTVVLLDSDRAMEALVVARLPQHSSWKVYQDQWQGM